MKERKGARGTAFTGCYRDSDGRERSAGSFSSRRAAERAAQREEQKVLAGSWHDATRGDISFKDYVENEWLPNKHLEISTITAYRSYTKQAVLPAVHGHFAGDHPVGEVTGR